MPFNTQVMHYDDFTISYVPEGTIIDVATTALAHNTTNKWFILKNDHREGLMSAAERGGFEECYKYFMEHRDQAHENSDLT